MWKLVTNDSPWVPDEIHILTTEFGKQLAETKLLGVPYRWRSLAKATSASGLAAGALIPARIHTAEIDGTPLQDITDDDSNTAMADMSQRAFFAVGHGAEINAASEAELVKPFFAGFSFAGRLPAMGPAAFCGFALFEVGVALLTTTLEAWSGYLSK